jgi:hypothetical protein
LRARPGVATRGAVCASTGALHSREMTRAWRSSFMGSLRNKVGGVVRCEPEVQLGRFVEGGVGRRRIRCRWQWPPVRPARARLRPVGWNRDAAAAARPRPARSHRWLPMARRAGAARMARGDGARRARSCTSVRGETRSTACACSRRRCASKPVVPGSWSWPVFIGNPPGAAAMLPVPARGASLPPLRCSP